MLVINRGSFLESKKPRRLRPELQGWFEVDVRYPVGWGHAESNQVYEQVRRGHGLDKNDRSVIYL
jgi:hypothetical protein